MEPVSLSLGIIPLIGGSIKLYKASRSRLRVFRHYSGEVDRVRKQFDRQRQFFLNEVHLALRLVIEDESLVQDMVENGDHLYWQRQSLERAMLDRLNANNCQVLKEIAADIGKTIGNVEKELECFECLEEARREGENIRDATRRLRGRVRIAFDMSKFNEWISELRKSNNDLKLLRDQASELGGSRKSTAPAANSSRVARTVTRSRLPSDFSLYGATRRASQALYDALWAAWSTQDSAHFRHLVKLFLETRSDEGVHLSLIISCLRQDLIQPIPSIVKVHVKSQVLDWIADQPASPASSHTAAPELPNPKRRRVVRFTDDNDEGPEAEEASPTPLPALDLKKSQHLCSELLPKENLPQEQRSRSPSPPVGYLDTLARSQDRFRHSFFHCCEGLCDPALCGSRGLNSLPSPQPYHHHHHPLQPEPARLDTLLAQPLSREALPLPDQLRLALRIASAVLKFSSTAWLGEAWGLRDLYFFERPAETQPAAATDLPASLQTLHFGVEWTRGRGPNTLMDVNAINDGGEASVAAALEEAKMSYGIRNVTMYNLGVALLSIGRWAAVDAHDVVQVRRMAAQTCPLGPRFREMTQRVLDCDFGYGKDLGKPKLQEAVYDGVLLELEAMIASMSLEEC